MWLGVLRRRRGDDCPPYRRLVKTICLRVLATAGAWCGCIGLLICRLLLGRFCFVLALCSFRFVMSCLRTLGRFLACGFDSFLGLSANRLGGLLRFLSNSFRRLLGFLAYGFGALFNFLPGFLSALLNGLNRSFLPERGQRSRCD